jgi:hypothetical protein
MLFLAGETLTARHESATYEDRPMWSAGRDDVIGITRPGGPGLSGWDGRSSSIGSVPPSRRAGAARCPKRAKGAPMSMVSGVIGGVDTHADVHFAAVIDTSGGLAGVQSFPGNGTSSVGTPLSRSGTRYSPALGDYLRPPRLPRYCVGVPNAMKKTIKKRTNNAMPAHLSTGLHIASLTPRRPSLGTAPFRTIHVHRSDRNARLR